jgi:hypothetical protein
MRKPVASLVVCLLLAVASSGCCCFDQTLGKICGKKFRCHDCGERYWNEWYSDPPDCCDPCNDCGTFVGPKSCCAHDGCCADEGCGCGAHGHTASHAPMPHRASGGGPYEGQINGETWD